MSEEELEQQGGEMGQQKQENSARAAHPFDSMFFGNRNRSAQNERQNQSQPEPSENPSMDGWLNSILNNKHLSNVNIEELMNHVDQLIVSLNELKPMFQKVSPMIERFIQKEK